MKLVSIKFGLSLVWVAVVIAVSLATGPHARANWVGLVGVALVPSLLMMWWWSDPSQTMSESIDEARR